jgi:SRSO17 transposase
VFLAYTGQDGSRALIDRELYPPQSRIADRDRCRAAGIGDDGAFAVKPELARVMIQRAVTARAPIKARDAAGAEAALQGRLRVTYDWQGGISLLLSPELMKG